MRALAALAVLSAALLAGCAGGTSSSSTDPPMKTVALKDDSFVDGNLTVPAGTMVHYANEGQRGHTVTIHWVGDPLTTYKIDQTLQPGQATAYTFQVPGTYHVFCRFHGTMTTGMASVVKVQ